MSPLQALPHTEQQRGDTGLPHLVMTQGSTPHNLPGVLRQGVKEALPKTQKQTQGGCQNEETKKCGPNEEENKTPEKDLNEMEISNLSNAQFKTPVSRMLQELIGYFSAIKDPGRNEGCIK